LIQLNLLPDVKLEYIKAQRSRRLVLTVSVLATIVSVVILVLLLSYSALQKKHLDDLSSDITNETNQLQQKPHISQILTVQNQLESLTALHAGKPAASRLFDYLNSVTPAQVNITTFNIDFTAQTASITGTADALSSVNKYVDNLKATTYTSSSNSEAAAAFGNIVLSSFGLTSGQSAQSATPAQNAQPATYTITLSYDQNIFDITQKINLSVPTQTVTHATAPQSGDLFKSPADTAGEDQ
jgi:Tfp pilus assembly protein PilN